MHYSGWLRLVAISAGIGTTLIAHNAAAWSWWWSASAGIVAFIAVPILCGLALGVGDRREVRRRMNR